MAAPKKKVTKARVDITLTPDVKELGRMLADEGQTSLSGLIERMILSSARARKIKLPEKTNQKNEHRPTPN